jgi:tRNA pseudouridine55 synthase
MAEPTGEHRVRTNPSGVVLLDKPQGMTSQTAVLRVRRLLGAAKAGHTGTLDPLATGLLPICVGEATKFSHVLLDAEKTYEAAIRLGVVTTTGDREGATVSTAPVIVRRHEVEQVLTGFVGEIDQVPPMHSAIKRNGTPLYKLARMGIVVPRSPRRVLIRSIELLKLDGQMLEVRVACSKGTYIRALAEDIGEGLGCGASLDALRRTAVGALCVQSAVTLEALEAEPLSARVGRLQGVDTPVQALPRIDLDPAQAERLAFGRVAAHHGSGRQEGLVRLYHAPSGRFLGLGSRDARGAITARRLMSSLEKHLMLEKTGSYRVQ